MWNAIYSLYKLLKEEENSEATYQNFFESNPIVFKILGFTYFQSYEKSSGKQLPFDKDRNFRPEPDFLCANLESSVVTIFELKTPFVSPLVIERMDGNRRKLNANAESYVSQATEYAESIRENSNTRKIVKTDLLLKNISSYRVVLVYGLAQNNDMSSVTKILENRKVPTTILCYDILLEKLVDAYSNTRKRTEELPGISIVYHLIIEKEQSFDRAFIADHGTSPKNRLSVFIENNYIVYRCIDSEGDIHVCKASAIYDKPIYLRFEFAPNSDGIYMSLNVNNEEHDLHVGRVGVNFDLQLKGFVLGSDILCKKFGKFYILETYYTMKTMSIENRLGSYHYFERKTSNSLTALHFNGSHYMVRVENGSLSQSDPNYQPQYVNDLSRSNSNID